MSLRRHFVPTAWLLCGLPLSLSFHMNATLAYNAIQSRKLNVPTLNSATLGSETELRSELGNASLARTAPSVEMSQVGQLFWAAARCQLARTSRENYCTGVSRARPPGASAIPVGTTDPVPQGDKKNKQTKTQKRNGAAMNPGAIPHSREQNPRNDFAGKQWQYTRPNVSGAR